MPFVTLILGFLLGLFAHILTMKINFKQRTLDNKIKVYDLLIISWVKMRNQIVNNTNEGSLDQIYGESQAYIGEIFLVTENNSLANKINEFNENFYRSDWHTLDSSEKNKKLETIKEEGLKLIKEMQEDIQRSTIFTKYDFYSLFKDFFKK